MIMKTQTHGFLNFYPCTLVMGLRYESSLGTCMDMNDAKRNGDDAIANTTYNKQFSSLRVKAKCNLFAP